MLRPGSGFCHAFPSHGLAARFTFLLAAQRRRHPLLNLRLRQLQGLEKADVVTILLLQRCRLKLTSG